MSASVDKVYIPPQIYETFFKNCEVKIWHMIIDHYENPRKVGSLDKKKTDSTVATGLVGDVMKLQIRVNAEGMIEEAKFKTFGCGSAIVSSSLVL